MKKKNVVNFLKKYASVILAMGLLMNSMVLNVAAENLSPLPSVNQSTNVPQVESSNLETQTNEMISVSMDQPESLLALLYAKNTPTNTTLTLFESVKQERMKGAGYTELRKGNVQYVQRTDSGKLPLSGILVFEGDKVQAIYQPLDDLMTFSTELMKTQAEGLQDTVIAQFSQYTAEHSDQLIGKFLQLNQRQDVENMSDEFILWHRYFQTVLQDWLANQPIPTKSEQEVLTYELQGEMAEQFTKVMKQHEAEFPELKEVFARFKERYDGTVALDFKEKQLAIGLIEGEAVIEYYVRFQEVPLTVPQADLVMSAEQFQSLTGIDWEAGLEEVKTRLLQ